MGPIETRTLGRNGPAVGIIGLGGTGLGNLYSAVSDAAAMDLVRSAHEAGIGLIDTAPVYGFGLSETRAGAVLRTLPPGAFFVSTKVGYRLRSLEAGESPVSVWDNVPGLTSFYDFSRDGALRSIESSLKRLGVDRVDAIAIHDPDEALGPDPSTGAYSHSHFREAMAGAYRVLHDLRSQGVVRAIGVGMNSAEMLVDFAREGDFDYFLLAGRYTLLEQAPLRGLLPLCVDRGIGIVIGGPYSSGILGSGAVPGAYYNYVPATENVLARVRRIEGVCAEFDATLRAAALQFPLAHEAVVSVIPGCRSRIEMQQSVDALREPIPPEFWAALKRHALIDPESPTG